ncbi:MAG: hypothetical protein ACRDHD_09505 [Candidatus Limnocylindria bacterium]
MAEYTVALPGTVTYNPAVVSPKIGKPVARPRAGVARGGQAARVARHRSHSLAPEHIGEAGSAALLAVAILGLAIFIAAMAMIASGLTIAGRFGSDPPPNVGQIGIGQVLGGAGLLALGGLLVGSSLAVLADVRNSRRIAAAVSALAAALSVAGVVLAVQQAGSDIVLPLALAVAAIIFGAASIILIRPRR